MKSKKVKAVPGLMTRLFGNFFEQVLEPKPIHSRLISQGVRQHGIGVARFFIVDWKALDRNKYSKPHHHHNKQLARRERELAARGL